MKQTVQSVINQDCTDWHLIVSDDCYPDDTISNYITELNDNRITYYRQKNNIGITSNFNFLLSKARAKYCVIIGCDDRMLSNYVSHALEDIHDADFYQPGVSIINDSGDTYLPLADRIKRIISPRKADLYSGENLAVSLCHGNWLYFPSILWRTDIVKRYSFNENYKIAEDLELELRMITDGYSLKVGKVALFQYRRSSKSLSSVEKKSGGIRFNEEVEVYDKFSNEFKRMGWNKASIAARVRLTSRLHQLIS